MKLGDFFGLNPQNPKNKQHSSYFRKRTLNKFGLTPEQLLQLKIDAKTLRSLGLPR